MFKRLALVALVSVALLSAKTYSFSTLHPATAGSVQLKPGDYKVKMDGSQVVLTCNDGKQIEITARVETGDRKYDETSVLTATVDGSNRIVSIKIGGTRTMLVFEYAGAGDLQLPN